LREVIPKDFYWFALLENDYAHLSDAHRTLLILALLSQEGESVLDRIPNKSLTAITWWLGKNLLEEKVMPLDQWLTTAFHLQKQRWDDSIDWLEVQPMSKILLMISIQSKFNQEQERQMKKGKRK
jgi:hypothetical protein|tara:strand:- start:45 stop:419 length:375 start_codon:yes stop_codon:yes gene_type:complete